MTGSVGHGFATKFNVVSITSSTGPLSLILVTTSTCGQIYQSRVHRKLGLWVQLLSFIASVTIPRVPMSAGLFQVSA